MIPWTHYYLGSNIQYHNLQLFIIREQSKTTNINSMEILIELELQDENKKQNSMCKSNKTKSSNVKNTPPWKRTVHIIILHKLCYLSSFFKKARLFLLLPLEGTKARHFRALNIVAQRNRLHLLVWSTEKNAAQRRITHTHTSTHILSCVCACPVSWNLKAFKYIYIFLFLVITASLG